MYSNKYGYWYAVLIKTPTFYRYITYIQIDVVHRRMANIESVSRRELMAEDPRQITRLLAATTPLHPVGHIYLQNKGFMTDKYNLL